VIKKKIRKIYSTMEFLWKCKKWRIWC
jgi:hypothetical protein